MTNAPTPGFTRRPAWLTIFGYVALAAFLVGTYYALLVAPTERTQQELFRITYTHASVAPVGLLAAVFTAVFAVMVLWRGRRADDVRMVAAAEVSLLFLALTLVGGMIYSKPTLGAWWAWDARITLSGIMVVLMIGFFVVRGLIDDPLRRARVSAVVALIVAAGAPLNRAATTLFRTVHPARSADMPPELQFVLFLNMFAVLLLFAWFFIERARLGAVAERIRAGAEEDGETRRVQEAVHV